MSLLRMSLTGAVLILAVVAVRALLMNRLPKKTFLALWALVLCRLLIPFELSSPLSVYTTAPAAVEAVMEQSDVLAVVAFGPGASRMVWPQATNDTTGWVSLGNTDAFFTLLWLGGALACGLFFLAAYLRLRLRFREATPAETEYVADWLSRQKLKRPLAVRVYDRVAAPLTYGVLRPVILLPKAGGWGSDEKLGYILAHEMVHVRRFDPLWKLLLTAALCIHWFNPLVWVMYVLVNRDMEVACDESVVRSLGEEAKSAYAKTLIGMEARQSGLMPLCSGFSKSDIQSRVKAIMKFKKTTALAALAAVMVVTTVAVCFATSAAHTAETDDSWFPYAAAMPEGYAEQAFPQLMSLRTEGYRDMTIREFREAVSSGLDTWEDPEQFAAEIDRMTGDELIRSNQYVNDDAWFLMGALRLSMMDSWQSNYVDCGGWKDGAEISVSLYYQISDPDGITVGERDRILKGFLVGALPDAAALGEGGDFESLTSRLQKEYHSDAMTVTDVRFLVDIMDPSTEVVSDNGNAGETPEPRQNAQSTDADYERVLALMTADYQKQSIREFNESLLRHMNDDETFFNSYWSVNEDFFHNKVTHALTDAQRYFLAVTLVASNNENSVMVKNEQGFPTVLTYSAAYSNDGGPLLVDVGYQIPYEVTAPDTVTVGERDGAISAIAGRVKDWLDSETAYELMSLSKEEIVAQLNQFAQQEKVRGIRIDNIQPEWVYYTFAQGGHMAPDGAAGDDYWMAGDIATAYFEERKSGNPERAYDICWHPTENANEKAAFLSSTEPLNGYLINSVEVLGENLWQINTTIETASGGVSDVINYVVKVDGEFWFAPSSADIPDDIRPQ